MCNLMFSVEMDVYHTTVFFIDFLIYHVTNNVKVEFYCLRQLLSLEHNIFVKKTYRRKKIYAATALCEYITSYVKHDLLFNILGFLCILEKNVDFFPEFF